jgi:hypothetical protein
MGEKCQTPIPLGGKLKKMSSDNISNYGLNEL